MPLAKDIAAELAKLPVLNDRTSETTAAEAEPAFTTLADYRDGGVFAGSFTGESPWERHPNGDELVQIIKGSTQLTILSEQEPEVFQMKAGMMIVVPQGCWHKFFSADGVSVMTVTPQPTDHSTAPDPREVTAKID